MNFLLSHWYSIAQSIGQCYNMQDFVLNTLRPVKVYICCTQEANSKVFAFAPDIYICDVNGIAAFSARLGTLFGSHVERAYVWLKRGRTLTSHMHWHVRVSDL